MAQRVNLSPTGLPIAVKTFLAKTVEAVANNTYMICSSTDPDILDFYVDGVLVGRITVA